MAGSPLIGRPRNPIVWDPDLMQDQVPAPVPAPPPPVPPTPPPGKPTGPSQGPTMGDTAKVVWDDAKAIIGGASFGQQQHDIGQMPGTIFNNPEKSKAMAEAGSGVAVGNIEGVKPPIIPKLTAKKPPVPDMAEALKAPRDKAGNINMDRLGGSDEARNVIHETAETKVPEMEAARRGQISHAETQDAVARGMGLSPEELLQRRKGQALNAEEAVSARRHLMASGEDLIARAKAAKGGSDEQIFAFKEALTRHEAIQAQVAGATAEAGRALSSFNIPAGGKLRQDAITRLLSIDRDRLGEIADKMSVIDDPAKAAEFASKAVKATTFDKIYEVWINALLSGPQTHVVNTVSNALTALWTIPETAIASGFGAARGGPNRVFAREATAKMFGLVEGTKDGLRVAGKSFVTGEPQFEAVTKVESPRYRAIPGKLGEAVRIPTRALSAEDEFFKAVGYRMELNALAMRDGLAKGLKGDALAQHIAAIKANPPDTLHLAAVKAARYLTFQQELGHMGQMAQRAIASSPAARIIVPFVRTPTNIMKFALERSPAAPALKEVREALAKGGPERDQALARITMGSTIGATIASLAAEGKISGGGPTDPGERSALYATGWQPYSVKLGDSWYSYSRLEPLGMILGISADFGTTASKMGEVEASDAASMIAISISKNLLSKTWLSGLSDLVQAIQDPEQFAEGYLRSTAGTLIPTGVAQVAKVVDPVRRDAQSVGDQLKARTPGLSQTLPPKRDIFGEELKYGGGVGPDILSPVYTSQNRGNKAAEEMVKRHVSGALPSRKIEGVDLNPAQYSEYVKAAGAGLQADMEALIGSPEYGMLSDDAKVKALEKRIADHREIARRQMIKEYPDLQGAAGARKDKSKAVRAELKTLPQ